MLPVVVWGDDMERLVQKINFGYGDMFVYGEADFEANQAMQEPLEKLFNYENLQENHRIIQLPCDKVWYIVDQGTRFATVMGKNIKDITLYEIEKIDIDGRYWSSEEKAYEKLKTEKA